MTPDETEESSKSKLADAYRTIGVFLGVSILLVAGCSAPPPTGSDSPRSPANSPLATSGDGQSASKPATDKYTQTWPKSYSTTTCEDWQETMTEAQTWAASADILTSGLNKVDGGTGLPSDSLVTKFRDDITEGCSADVPGLVITDVAYGVYTIGHDQYGP